MDQRKTITILILLLIVAGVAAAAAWYLTPSSSFPLNTDVPIAPSSSTPEPLVDEQPQAIGEPITAPASNTGAFDLNVLQRTGYKSLDLRPLQDGLLPVKAPATAGKANPFL